MIPTNLPDLAEAYRLEHAPEWPNPHRGCYVAAIAAHMAAQGPELALALGAKTGAAWTWSQSGATEMGDAPRGWLTRAGGDGFAIICRPDTYRRKLEAAPAPLSRPGANGAPRVALLSDYVPYGERSRYRDRVTFDLAGFLCGPVERVAAQLVAKVIRPASPVYAVAMATIAAEHAALASLDSAGAAWVREYGGSAAQDRRAGAFPVYLGAHTGHPPRHPGIKALGVERVDVLAGGRVSVAHLTLSPTVWRALLDAAAAEPTS